VLVATATATVLAVAGAPAPTVLAAPAGDAAALETLIEAVATTAELPHTGRVAVVSFGERGPQAIEVAATDARVDLSALRGASGATGVGPAGLVRLGRMEAVETQLHRFARKYLVDVGEAGELDTGPALPLRVRERRSGTLREVLHVDVRTGVLVRRDTYDRVGDPVRVAAYLDLSVEDVDVARQPVANEPEPATVDADLVTALEREGFAAATELPAGYGLVAATRLADTSVPTVHLVYSDGLYTVSVFEQLGRMARAGRAGATELEAPSGGTVWRWPGSEPRRLVWTGDGSTFTAVGDAPTDELVAVVDGLPVEPRPSTLERLTAGLSRVGSWLWPGD
jgi:hypothetical protein